MNLNALADRPAVSALSQRVCLDPYREMMSLFEHDRKYGARLARVLGKNSSATFKLADYRAAFAALAERLDVLAAERARPGGGDWRASATDEAKREPRKPR
jgi:hypothetical protein